MDELTVGFEELIEKEIMPVPEKALSIMKEEIDIAAQDVYNFLKEATPIGETCGLLKSLQKTKSKKQNYYGYDVEYVGNNKNGVAYQKIASVLNFGTKDGRVAPKHFITRAQRRLKGLDGKINERIGDL